MNDALKQMLARYNNRSFVEHEQSLREIVQEIALVGLWRGKFFEHAAFYGGTALRIFYGLDRFSEDLDFTLLTPHPEWSWKPFGDALVRELASYGFEISFVEKEKSRQSAIKSAFLKTRTVQEMLRVGIRDDVLRGIHPETLIQIRVEIDSDPKMQYTYEHRILSQPVGVSINCVNESNLFVCKMHAAFFRAWKGRVKGRDWYDVAWFIRRKVPLDLTIFSKLIGSEVVLDRTSFLEIAEERINRLDIDLAIGDVIHFVRDKEVIERNWSKQFFHTLFKDIKTLLGN